MEFDMINILLVALGSYVLGWASCLFLIWFNNPLRGLPKWAREALEEQ